MARRGTGNKPALNLSPSTPTQAAGASPAANMTPNGGGPNTPTLEPIPMNDLSGNLDNLNIAGAANEDTSFFPRSGQQSPKPRGRKALGADAGTTPATTRRNPSAAGAQAGTPGTVNFEGGKGARKLTPLKTAGEPTTNQPSPSRGQRSPLRRHLVRANASFHADADIVATPPPGGRAAQQLDKIVQGTTVDPNSAGRRAYRLATQLPTSPNDVPTPATKKKHPVNKRQQRAMANKPQQNLVPSSPAKGSSTDGTTSPTHAKRSIISPEKPPEIPKLTVVLDLDETLVHSIFHNGADSLYRQHENRQKSVRSDRVQSFHLKLADGDAVTVNKRPKLAAFLKAMQEEFHAQVFTAALSCYAEPVLNRLDPKRSIFKRRLYREGCTPTGTGAFAKDLSLHFKDLSRVVLVDNNPVSLMRQPDNGLLVPSFFDDPNDDVLPTVLDFLRQLSKEKDIRPVIRKMRENSA